MALPRLFRTVLAGLSFLVFGLAGLAPRVALAAEPAAAEERELPYQPGPKAVSLPHDVELALPEGYLFLAQPEAGRLMEKNGNLYNENLLGLVMPSDPDEEWAITLRYDEDGFVKDDEALDANEILAALREGEPEYNEERKKLGFGPIHSDHWLEDPRYDKLRHQLVWSLVVKGDHGESVNFATRVLGRKGYVAVNLLTDTAHLGAYRRHGVEILSATSFGAGHRYEDFDASRDKVAEYGLTGLVLGGAGVSVAAKAVKIGLLAKTWKGIVAILVAGKKGIVAVFAAVAAAVRRLLGRKQEGAGTGPT